MEVAGHTADVGKSRDTNAMEMRLSQNRANSVKAYLVECGVAPDRIVAKGYGDTVPIADNSTKEGKAKNRRVEFNVLERVETGMTEPDRVVRLSRAPTGLGLEVSESMIITDVAADGPAAKSGRVSVGDMVVAVNGQSAASEPTSKLLRSLSKGQITTLILRPVAPSEPSTRRNAHQVPKDNVTVHAAGDYLTADGVPNAQPGDILYAVNGVSMLGVSIEDAKKWISKCEGDLVLIMGSPELKPRRLEIDIVKSADGIGMQIETYIHRLGIFVKEVLPDGGAAGLVEVNDRILQVHKTLTCFPLTICQVNDINLEAARHDEAVAAFDGLPNTSFKLVLLR